MYVAEAEYALAVFGGIADQGLKHRRRGNLPANPGCLCHRMADRWS
jgi:hypothetical protein